MWAEPTAGTASALGEVTGQRVEDWCLPGAGFQAHCRARGLPGNSGRREGLGQALFWKGTCDIFVSYPRRDGGGGVGRSDQQWHHFFLLRCSRFARKHVFDRAEPLGGRFMWVEETSTRIGLI